MSIARHHVFFDPIPREPPFDPAGPSEPSPTAPTADAPGAFVATGSESKCVPSVPPRDAATPSERCDWRARWKLQGPEIGSGFFGTVYGACDGDTANCGVVVKVVDRDEEAYHNEVHIHRKVNEVAPDAAPRLLDAWTCGDRRFIAMERMERDVSVVPATSEQVVQLRAHLRALRDHGIVHRDIKSENVLVKNGRAYLCDFGNALDYERAGRRNVSYSETIENHYANDVKSLEAVAVCPPIAPGERARVYPEPSPSPSRGRPLLRAPAPTPSLPLSIGGLGTTQIGRPLRLPTAYGSPPISSSLPGIYEALSGFTWRHASPALASVAPPPPPPLPTTTCAPSRTGAIDRPTVEKAASHRPPSAPFGVQRYLEAYVPSRTARKSAYEGEGADRFVTEVRNRRRSEAEDARLREAAAANARLTARIFAPASHSTSQSSSPAPAQGQVDSRTPTLHDRLSERPTVFSSVPVTSIGTKQTGLWDTKDASVANRLAMQSDGAIVFTAPNTGATTRVSGALPPALVSTIRQLPPPPSVGDTIMRGGRAFEITHVHHHDGIYMGSVGNEVQNHSRFLPGYQSMPRQCIAAQPGVSGLAAYDHITNANRWYCNTNGQVTQHEDVPGGGRHLHYGPFSAFPPEVIARLR